jgi:hypothetical protein
MRGVLDVREAMTRSVEEREIRVKSDRPRTFLLTLRMPALYDAFCPLHHNHHRSLYSAGFLQFPQLAVFIPF